MMIAHPAAHYPQMPWAAAGPDGALQPVFLANPAEYQQMMQQQRPGSVDSESSKSSSRRGSLSKSGNDYNKFVPSMKKMQLGEYFLQRNFIFRQNLKPLFSWNWGDGATSRSNANLWKEDQREAPFKRLISWFWNWWLSGKFKCLAVFIRKSRSLWRFSHLWHGL